MTLLGSVVLIIAHNASFDRRFLERRLPVFAQKYWTCSRSDIDWKAEGIRSSALEFVAYALGFFQDGHRDASDCRATLLVGATAAQYRAAGITGSLGTGEIADMAMGSADQLRPRRRGDPPGENWEADWRY